MTSLAGQVAIVTGGAGGIGSAICERLRATGAEVIAADIAESADRHLDVTSRESVDELFGSLDRLDILVNAAGFPRDVLITEMTDDDWRVVIDVCLYGTFACCRAAAPLMIQRNYGRMVNISSRAYLGNPGQANYSAAKAGVVGLTKSLAKELGRHQITVNAVAPGLIETAMVKSHPKYDQIADRAARESFIRRVGQPNDVASAVAFLVSPDASYITGDVIHVSGGRFG